MNISDQNKYVTSSTQHQQQSLNGELKKYNLKAEMQLQKDIIDKEIIKMKYLKANHGIFIDIFVFEDTEDTMMEKSNTLQQKGFCLLKTRKNTATCTLF